MIQCICGPTGGGKSLYAVWLMHQLAKSGRRIATNIELTDKHPAYNQVFKIGTEQFPILDKDKAFFSYFPRDARGHSGMNYFIDEADIDLDCTYWNSMADQVRIYFKQHRKLKDNIFLIVQDPNFLYNRIRSLVHEYVWCTMDGDLSWAGNRLLMHLIPKHYWRYRRASFSHIDMKPTHLLRTGSMSFAEGQRYWSWYKTEQLIGNCEF